MPTGQFDIVPPPPSDSAEQMRRIAREEGDGAAARHEVECMRTGSVCKIWEEVTSMRITIDDVNRAWAEERGKTHAITQAQAKKSAKLAYVVSIVALGSTIFHLFWSIYKK